MGHIVWLAITSNERLNEIFEMHQNLIKVLENINAILSPSLLIEIMTCLYTAVFYLYRLCVASLANSSSSNLELVHYVISGCFRFEKLIILVILGQLTKKQFRKPLETFLQTNLFSFSSLHQSQIQLLITQWSIQLDNCFLSASHVVNIGPWLLAPIFGNIITYLLVALQFQKK